MEQEKIKPNIMTSNYIALDCSDDKELRLTIKTNEKKRYLVVFPEKNVKKSKSYIDRLSLISGKNYFDLKDHDILPTIKLRYGCTEFTRHPIQGYIFSTPIIENCLPAILQYLFDNKIYTQKQRSFRVYLHTANGVNAIYKIELL